jgi:hypothetical protein
MAVLPNIKFGYANKIVKMLKSAIQFSVDVVATQLTLTVALQTQDDADAFSRSRPLTCCESESVVGQ